MTANPTNISPADPVPAQSHYNRSVGARLIISGDRKMQSGLLDLLAALAAWRIWSALGLADTTSRYRRTVIGPFWITIGLAIQALAIGFIFSGLMGVSVQDYLPYVALGLLVWQFFAGTVNESAAAFSSAGSLIRNFPLPLGVHVLRAVWRNVLSLLHHAVFVVTIMPFTAIVLEPSALLLVPGLLLLVLNVTWLAVILSLVSVRFRDIPPMVANAMQMLFFVTPVIWSPERLGGLFSLLTWNPAYHLIELIRSPLLGIVPSLTSYAVAIGCAVFGWVCALMFYGRYHWRVAYWV